MKDTTAGTLVVAATPIGQPGDISPRLVSALATVPVIAAEDTRRLRRLAATLGVRPAGRIVSYYDAVEGDRVPGLLATLAAGEDVLLVTDAGMPAVSDPGYRLVAAAAAAGLTVTVLPGPSAVTAAVAVSGLPSDRFCFEGFPPRRAAERARRFASLAAEPRTMVFFESPHRLAGTLAGLAASFGPDRRAVACREMTKTYEEIRRGTLAELAEWAAAGVRGEITLVVAGAAGAASGQAAGAASGQAAAGRAGTGLAAEVASRESGGLARKDAIAAVARERGLRKRDVYAAVVADKQAAGKQATDQQATDQQATDQQATRTQVAENQEGGGPRRR
jgi:16S rRNA (cytidine1402-2'-O)-methyltransferase